jgi:hypothetical protein
MVPSMRLEFAAIDHRRPWLAWVIIATIVASVLVASTAMADPPPSPPGKGNVKRLQPADFRLFGGWRLAQEYARGGLAIDFDNGRVFMAGHAQRDEICEFSLSRRDEQTGQLQRIAPGMGDDVTKWPRLDPVKVHPKYWDEGYAGGLCYKDNILWVSPKKFYDMNPPPNFHLFGKNFQTGKIETILVRLPRQEFGGGFVKGMPNEVLLGCGGYESGQGSVAGPTLATIDGNPLIRQVPFSSKDFARRELRPPSYWPIKHHDAWYALEPRGGVGRWASDRVHAGGIWHARGIAFWALLGIGEIDYTRQTQTFAPTTETWLYTYDPWTLSGVEFHKWDFGHVHGHEVDSSGRVYLLVRNAWASGVEQVDSAIKIFEIAN